MVLENLDDYRTLIFFLVNKLMFNLKLTIFQWIFGSKLKKKILIRHISNLNWLLSFNLLSIISILKHLLIQYQNDYLEYNVYFLFFIVFLYLI